MEKTLSEIFKEGYRFDETILAASENKRLFFFLGAGVSRLMGTMGWDSLARELVKKAFPSYNKQNSILNGISNNKELITIAHEEFLNKNKLDEFYQIFGSALRSKENDVNIYEILSQFNAIFLTTNADNLFEEVLGSEFCHSDFEIKYLDDKDHLINHLFYLHGHYTEDIQQNEKSLVFTTKNYIERYNEPKFIEFLKRIFENPKNIIVFIGYGLNEYELIDYIATKTGYKDNSAKSYVLQGFCSGDDVLYKTKKMYFNSLNIDLIPFCMDEKGYGELIDVLKELLENYKPSIAPVYAYDIDKYTEEFKSDNVNEVVRLLSDFERSKHCEIAIRDNLLKHNNYNWIRALYDKGIFSGERITKKIEYGAFPLLEVFGNWVASDENDAQLAAINLLNNLSEENIEILIQNNNSIIGDIVKIIFNLNKNNISDKFTNILTRLKKSRYYLMDVVEEKINFNRIFEWELSLFNEFLQVIYGDISLEKNNDLSLYHVKKITTQLIDFLDNSKNKLKDIFNYFVDLFISKIKTENNYYFIHTKNLDNLEKIHCGNLKFVFGIVKKLFVKLDNADKNSCLNEMVCEDIKLKLALYLMRKYDSTIRFNFEMENLYNEYYYYNEFYMFLKKYIETDAFTATDACLICELVKNGKFGFDDEDFKKKEIQQYVFQKRLAIYELLKEHIDQSYFDEIESVVPGLKAIDPIEDADETDYISKVEWVEDEFFSKDNLSFEIPQEAVNQYDNLSISSPSWEYSRAGLQFVDVLKDEDDQVKLDVLNIVRNLSVLKIMHVVYGVKEKIEFFDKTYLIDFCIKVLDSLDYENVDCKNLAKVIYETLRKIKLETVDEAHIILAIIKKYIDKSINAEKSFNEDNKVYSNLINFGDYEKYQLMFDCNVYLKQNNSYNESEEDLKLYSELLTLDLDKTFKYTLCSNYQNVKYFTNGKIIDIFDSIVGKGENFDIVALVLCVSHSNALFSEIVEKITNEYLNNLSDISGKCEGNLFTDRFNSYIVGGYYLDKITFEQINKFFANESFINTWIMFISIFVTYEKFDLYQHISIIWDYLKNYKNDLCIKYADKIIYCVKYMKEASIEMLSLLLEVVEYCEKENLYGLKLEKILSFTNIDFEKFNLLLKQIIDRQQLWDKKEFDVIFDTYKEYSQSRLGKELINKLVNDGKLKLKDSQKYMELF